MWSFTLIKYLAVTSLLGHLAGAAAIERSSHDASSCPGYKTSNVVNKNGHITGADLNLAGAACNVYGTDLKNLKLSVEYQTSQY
jgi:alpha-glucosidase